MGIGTSLFLIAVGAILYFAVNADVEGLEISTVGLILMGVGLLGLAISLFFASAYARGHRADPYVDPNAPPERPVPRDRDYY